MKRPLLDPRRAGAPPAAPAALRVPRARRRIAAALAVAGLVGCADAPVDFHQGYVEGEFVSLASPFGGELVELRVARGDEVRAGQALFALDPAPEALQLAQTEERVAQARARLADLERGGRPSELAALEARLESARAALRRAEHDLERRQALAATGHPDAVSEEELDRYAAERDVRRADVATLEAELETARLGGRPDAVAAARSEVDALVAALAELRWRLEQKSVSAPADGVVEDSFYWPGEYVPAGRPVLSLLPEGALELRFFVPQAALATLAVGDPVEVRVDGAAAPLAATIVRIAPRAEFTPPVIYSRESRSKLVFLVEARPAPGAADVLRPGQPIEVRPVRPPR